MTTIHKKVDAFCIATHATDDTFCLRDLHIVPHWCDDPEFLERVWLEYNPWDWNYDPDEYLSFRRTPPDYFPRTWREYQMMKAVLYKRGMVSVSIIGERVELEYRGKQCSYRGASVGRNPTSSDEFVQHLAREWRDEVNSAA